MATTTFNDLITFSRGSNATVTGPNGLIQWAPSNLLTNSQDFEASAWTKQGNGVAIAPTVTANAGVAPDGTTTADRVQFSLNGGTATGDISQIFQSATLSAPAIFSVYLKSNTASSFNMQITNPDGSGTAITVTPEWQRFNGISATPPGAVNYQIRLRGGQTPANSNTADILVWGAQLELGSTATTYNNTSVRNLAGFSEAFDGAGWSRNNSVVVTGAQANPVNGLFNAQKLMENTTTNTHQVQQGIATVVGGLYTASAYVKAAERTWVAVQMQSGTFAYVNLVTGALGNTSGSPAVSIISAGSGWWRIGVTAAASATSSTFAIYTASANGTVSYTGDGNSGVYIYGAQLSNSASLDPYVPTPGAAPSSTAYYGPRFDYDPVTLLPRGLLVEEARTNLATYSNTFSDASWVAIGAKNLVANSTVSPDGEVNASTLTDNSAVAFQGASKSVTVANDNATYTASLYVRKTTGGTSATFGFNFQLTGGTLVGVSPRINTDTGALLSGSGTVQNAGAYWRLSATVTNNTTGNTSLVLSVFAATAPNGVSVDSSAATGSAIIYGAQLEAGAFATSYIPTIASTVTRSADVATITGSLFSQWFNPAEGTLIVNIVPSLTIAANTRAGTITDGTNRIADVYIDAGAWKTFNGTTNVTPSGSTAVLNADVKFAAAYRSGDYAASMNGGSVGTATTAGVQVSNRLTMGTNITNSAGFLNGHIRSIRYVPVRAADFQLQQVTT